MKYGLTVLVPDNDPNCPLSGLRVAVMWTYGFAKEFTSMSAAVAFGERLYGKHWFPRATLLVIAQSTVNELCELYSGRRTIKVVNGEKQMVIRDEVRDGLIDRPSIVRIHEILHSGNLEQSLRNKMHQATHTPT